MDWSWLSSPQAWIGLFWLSLMEIVLGIDNLIFLSILVEPLPASTRDRIRRIGLILAMGMRIALLLALTWIMGLTEPLFTVATVTVTGRDLVLVLGGGFLIAKATQEIFAAVEGPPAAVQTAVRAAPHAGWILAQVVVMDIVFSLDSVITAVGMVSQVPVMVAAIILAVGAMLWLASPIAELLHRHPSLRVLALSFLLLIGVLLLAEGFGQHVSRGYVYSAMAFALLVELLNMRMRAAAIRQRRQPPSDHEDRLAG